MGGASLVAVVVCLHAQVVERTSVPNGGELVTVFQGEGDSRIPVVSYLKDTLGDDDPANDRIRQIWVLSHKRQSLPRNILAGVPFLYTRLPSSPPPPGRVPGPILDAGKPHDTTISGIFQQVLQVTAFDPLGMPYRAATRSYRLNRSQHRELRVAEAATALAPLAAEDADIRAVRARLVLSSRLLGGLVSDRNLDLVYEKETIRTEEMRGRNWELLRQQAERNNLIFEPLRIAAGPPSHAILAISREELRRNKPVEYHGRFLGISNPRGDSGLRKHAASLESPAAIPLALYSLEHPKAPFLLADMRNSFAPKRREMVRRAAQDLTVGVLGVSRFASLHYFAASWVWNFVTNRRGAANNRAWRIRSYAELRHKLSVDTTLDPALRADLQRRIERLSINPLEDRSAIDGEIARVQYESLRAWAQNPKGLAMRLERTRQEEAAVLFARSHKQRVAWEAARWITFGMVNNRVKTGSAMLAELDRRRKIETYARQMEFLLDVAPIDRNSPPPDGLLKAARELARLAPGEPAFRPMMDRLASHYPIGAASSVNETNAAGAAESIENQTPNK